MTFIGTMASALLLYDYDIICQNLLMKWNIIGYIETNWPEGQGSRFICVKFELKPSNKHTEWTKNETHFFLFYHLWYINFNVIVL
jgi:hypothetical protein